MKQRRFGYGLYIVIGLLILLMLGYDTFQPRSIETVAVISGVGIEAGENDEIRLSVQLMKSNNSGGGEGNTASSVVMSAEGKTIPQACENLVSKTGSVLFWSHCAVIIINRDLASNTDMVPHLDMFFRSSNFRNTSAVIVCDESPMDILNADTISETVSAFGIRKLMDDQEYESNCVYTTLKRFVKDYYSICQSTVVTGIELTELENTSSDDNANDTKKSAVALADTAIFKKGKFVDYLSDYELNGYKWLTDTMEMRTVTLNDFIVESENNEKNTMSFTVFATSVKLKPMYEDGKYILSIKIDAKAEIISIYNNMQSVNISIHKLKRRYDELGDKLGKSIKNDIESAWRKMSDTDCDYCGIQDLFYSYLGNTWKNAYFSSTEQALENITKEYEMDITVIAGGLNKRYKLK